MAVGRLSGQQCLPPSTGAEPSFTRPCKHQEHSHAIPTAMHTHTPPTHTA